MPKKLSLSIDDEENRRIEELMKKTGARTKIELFNYAMATYDWLVSEAEEGRGVGSFDKDAKDVKELEMPPLRYVRKRQHEDGNA
jgi:hypothetical protein